MASRRLFISFIFVLRIAACVCLSNVNDEATETVFPFEDVRDLRGKSLNLLDATRSSRTKRATAAGSDNVTIVDNHDYYTKRVAVRPAMTSFYTREFDRVFATYPAGSHERMNNAHRLAWIVPMKFSFPFYGHTLDHMVITTGGYLYANDISHSYLGFSQYIAPLKADFDTLHGASRISYVDEEDAFWVRWENLQLNESRSFGNFSFQCVLFKNGSIVFDYISVPEKIKDMKNFTKYTVTVGLSDAYYNDTHISPTHIRRLIVKYHVIDIGLELITNNTVVNFTHETTCNQLHKCGQCLDRSLVKHFNCSWCHELRQCSSGVDRRWQAWADTGCHGRGDTCSTSTSTSTTASTSTSTSASKAAPPMPVVSCSGNDCRKPLSLGQVLLIVVILLIVLCLIGCVVMFVVFAYRNPTSAAGMWLMEHRPSALHARFFKSGGDGGDNYKVDVEHTYDNMSTA